MRKSFIAAAVICLLLIPFTVSQSADLYPIFGGGVKVGNAGKPVFAAFGGANIPFVTNDVKDYQVFNRSQIFYDNQFGAEAGSGQGITTFLMMRKGINAPDPGMKLPFTEIELNGGVGFKYMIDEGKDPKAVVLKFESGATIWKSFRLMVGVDYTPQMPNDVWFPYVALDLSPRL